MHPVHPPVLSILREAGRLIVSGAGRMRIVAESVPGTPHPTSDLDREVDSLLHRGLPGLFGQDTAYFTEEHADDPSRLRSSRILIVDPIDCTASLLHGHPEAVVSVAYWADGDLRLAWVHHPFTGETFHAERGAGAWVDGTRISVSAARPNPDIVMSRSEHRRGLLAPLAGVLDYRVVGSIALKMALVAAGRADGTVTIHDRHEWDIAAGTFLVEEAGGRVTDGRGWTIRFNREVPIVRGLVVSNGAVHGRLVDAARRLEGT